MKVNKNNQLGMNFTQKIKDEFYNLHNDKYFKQHPEEFIRPYREQWLNILSDDGNKNLLFTKTSLEVANKIKIEKFKPSMLKIKQEKKLTFLINDSRFYRVLLKSDEIMAIKVTKTRVSDGQDYISYDSFKILPLKNIVIYPQNQDDYINDKHFAEFLKLLIFIEYSDVEEINMNPNQTYGTKKQGKFLNETDKSFIIVDSAWNKIIVRVDGFSVSGHIRIMQKNGIKLVWVNSYNKNGYVRKSKKNNL